MSDLTKIPVTVITGFLGAGKTTLIRHLMANPEGRKLAVLVNEFGTVGVDGEILRQCADENCPDENIVELANGCICCTVADEFIPTIEALLARPTRPDHILIETSGLALPKPLLKAFDWPAIRSKITVDGVIAVADAEAVAAGRFAPDVAADEDDLAARPSHHDDHGEHEHDDFDTVVIELPEIADPAALVAAIERLAREQNILRVKGHIAVAGKPMRLLVQAVGERVRHQYDRPWGTDARRSALVVIAEHDDVDEAAIRAVLLGGVAA